MIAAVQEFDSRINDAHSLQETVDHACRREQCECYGIHERPADEVGHCSDGLYKVLEPLDLDLIQEYRKEQRQDRRGDTNKAHCKRILKDYDHLSDLCRISEQLNKPLESDKFTLVQTKRRTVIIKGINPSGEWKITDQERQNEERKNNQDQLLAILFTRTNFCGLLTAHTRLLSRRCKFSVMNDKICTFDIINALSYSLYPSFR